jgi:hypothetical protein
MDMSRYCLWVLLAFVLSEPLPALAGTLISKESRWLTWSGAKNPSRQLHAWTQADFMDDAWEQSPAPFRYGDGVGGTLIPGMQNAFPCYFLRRTFSITAVEQVEDLELNMDFDDGFAVWLNGAEVLRVNAPANLSYNGMAPANHESGTFESFSLGNAIEHLVEGQNLLAIQGFNVNLSSSDFMLHPELLFRGLDTEPPTVMRVDPAPGMVGSFQEVRIVFSEPVQGVQARDLSLNGRAALEVTGAGEEYVFTFGVTEPGELTLQWVQDAGIKDLASRPNAFDWHSPSEIRLYQLVDLDLPVIHQMTPPPGRTLAAFSEVELVFSEPVRGLDAGDLLVNGHPAETLSGVGAGPYRFVFPPQDRGMLQMRWRAEHGIQDGASEPNALQTVNWQYEVRPDLDYGGVVISEIMAGNQSGIQDDERERVDWVELYNKLDSEVDLSGWSLSDDPTDPGKWMFDEQTIGPGAYLIVFASAKDRSNVRRGGSPHTNFRLSRAGEFLGLYSPELPRHLVSDLGGRYPEQRNDHSYGRLSGGGFGYFKSPSPGTINRGDRLEGILPEPRFSVSRGFYDRPFQLILSSPVEGARVRYTLDQSEPTADQGMDYTGPIAVSRQTTIRAAAFKEGMLPSRTVTHSYLYRLSASRRSLPVLSLVTDQDHLTGPQGIMETSPRNTSRRGRAWERPVSVEYFHPDGSTGFHIDAGLRIQGGNYVRERYNPSGGLPFSKYSFRLYFRGNYGASSLEYPLIERSPAKAYKQIVLRAGMNDHSDPFVVDELVRRLAADMGQVSSQGTLVNLYINGKYKGYYNPTERIDEDFLDSWQGGQGLYDIIAQFGEVRAGDTVEWNRLKQVMRRDLSVPGNYLQAGQWLDIDHFIDYLILNIYVGTRDWPHNNWRAARERAEGARWRFYVWDAEWSFLNQGGNVNHNTLTSELAVDQDIARFYQSLARNPAFRTRFADRVHQHFFGEGALTDEHILERFQELRVEMFGVRRISNSIATSWIPRRRERVFEHLANEGLFLEGNIPAFSEAPGGVLNAALKLSTTKGRIYYTLDGSDPFLAETVSMERAQLVAEEVIKSVSVPGDGPWNSAWKYADRGFDDSNWLRGRGGVGYDEAQTYRSHIGIDVDEVMNDKHTSVYVRIPFSMRLQDLEDVNLMLLHVKYDDGFVAYLNGRRIAGANAPANPQWNASASGDHADSAAVQYQAFKVSEHLGALKDGSNMLAFQGLNSQLSSSDFLLDATLETGVMEPARASEEAVLYDAPIPIDGLTEVRARSLDAGGWSALSAGVFYPGDLQADLKLTEIMYHPPGGDAFEFIELTNTGPVSADLGRHTLRGIGFSFPPGTVLAPGASLVLASDRRPSAFASRYPGVTVRGWFGGSLSNRGETLVLEDAQGHYISGVSYEDRGAWPQHADGEGYSLELLGPHLDSSSPASWWGSNLAGGSPGVFVPHVPGQGLVISEVMAAPEAGETVNGPVSDWIEVENRGSLPVVLDGHRLRDASGQEAFVFDAGITLAPGERRVIWRSVERLEGRGFSFGLDREGDTVLLLDPDGARLDAVTFGWQVPGYSLIQDASGHWALGDPSPGEPDQAVATAPLDVLRINEIMSHLMPGEDAWLELYNTSPSLPVALDGLHFRLNGHVSGWAPYAYLGQESYAVMHAGGSTPQASLRLKVPMVGGHIEMIDAQGGLIDEVHLPSLDQGYAYGRLPNGSGEFRVFTMQGSPGMANALIEPVPVRINEVMARNRTLRFKDVQGVPDWIELHHTGPQALEMGDMRLRLSEDQVWGFPNGTFIEPNGFLVIWCDGDGLVERGNFPGLVISRSLKDEGELLELVDLEGRVIDRVSYGLQLADQSIGRHAGDWTLLEEISPGGPNGSKAALGRVEALRINEWHSGGEGTDWLELYHGGSAPVALEGLFLTDDPSLSGKTKHQVAPLSFIGPQGWVVFRADGNPQRGADHLGFKLDIRGETLRLYSEDMDMIDELAMGPMPAGVGSFGWLPDGKGSMVEFSDQEVSPGKPNSLTVEGLHINEVLLRPVAPLEPAIEIVNQGHEAVDLSGWSIGSEMSSMSAFRVPSGTRVGPGEYAVLHAASWGELTMQDPTSWWLEGSDTLYLSEMTSSGKPTGRRLSMDLLPVEAGESVGRIQGSASSRAWRQATLTFGVSSHLPVERFRLGKGAANEIPHTGDLIISEVLPHWNPGDVHEGDGLKGLEYIELWNRSDDTVILSSATDQGMGWRISGGIDFTFRDDVSLKPSESLLVVNFDPLAEPLKLQALQEKEVMPAGIEVLGPYDGRLNNGGDRVSLQRLVISTDPVDPEKTLAWVDEDQVTYLSQRALPLPPEARASALTRLTEAQGEVTTEHWAYALPTPGQHGMHAGGASSGAWVQGISIGDTGVTLHVATEREGTYRVQYTPSLKSAVWKDLQSMVHQEGVQEIEDPSGMQDSRFYRVVGE